MPVSTHHFHLLRVLRDNPAAEWVAATVVSKYRSSYRLPGAMLLVGPDGHSYGLVSGGCLEADIRLNARKVRAFNQARCILYDSMDEGNIAAELGLGCNGRVEVLVQPLGAAHRRLLLRLLDRMESGRSSLLLHCFQTDDPSDLNALILLDDTGSPLDNATGVELPPLQHQSLNRDHQLVAQAGRKWSLNRYRPPVSLWVFGGGMDARPLVSLAASLGWRVTLVDHRPANGQEADFPDAERVLRQDPAGLDVDIDADAAIVMTHNLELDAAWLGRLEGIAALRYVGLLGPVERREDVVEMAQISTSSALLPILHGPMGLDIGGDMPESVALSTLAQCHQILFAKESGKGP